ncbi:MAG: GntR family transcriptional regulator [Cytophagaceae bacterium]|nr:MAG: GntR family transcriptional regulator [Cytophagaceae bacterium]
MKTEPTTNLIDRLSTVPYYQQLSDALEGRIAQGQITAGARLPSENDLCLEFGLSRATVRQALQLLETRGFATRVNGRGVYATEPESGHGWMIQGAQGFLENAVGHQNRLVSTQVLDFGRKVLPAFACVSFSASVDSEGYCLERLRCLDGKPALYSINYSPDFLIPVIESATDVLAGNASFSELLTRSGYPLGGANRTIWAVSADEKIAAHLEIPKSSSVLHIRSISWTTDGKRFDIYDTWVCSDVIPLEINVSTVPLRAT